MRTDIHFILKCSECGNELECDLEKSRNGTGASSAFEAKMSMAIKPCRGCMRKAREPIEMMRDALDKIQSS